MDYSFKISFLKRLLGKYKFSQNTKEFETYCCFCNHFKKKLSINLDTDYWRCWICGKSGKKLFYIIKKVGIRSDLEEYIRKHKAASVSERTFTFEDLEFKLSLPEGYVSVLDCKHSVVGSKVYKYLTEKRGLTEEDILRFKIGTALSGENREKIIFPSFSSIGFLNMYNVRSLNGRYWGPKTPRGYRNKIVPNELNIDWDQPVVLVEGPFDMMKSIKNTVPLFGSELSIYSRLFEKIVESEIPVFLGFDADAKKKTAKIAKNFLSYGVPVYIMDVSPYGDLGEMTKKEGKYRYDSAKSIDEKGIFRQRLELL